MPYARGLGFPIIDQLSSDPATDDGQGGIDWTQVITTGEQVIGQVVNHGTPLPTRYPTYTPVSTAMSSALPLVLVGGALLLLMRRR